MDRLYKAPDVGATLVEYMELAFGNVPILGDLIEIFTGVEDGDYTDLATWVNSLLNAAQTLTAIADGITDFINSLIALLSGVPGVGTSLEKLASTVNSKQLGVPLSFSINNDEDATFPRAALTNGAASLTSSGGGSTASSHTHPLGQIPQYQPQSGGITGDDFLEIGFIRATKKKVYRYVGLATGGAATFAGIANAYIAVFTVNKTTGDLTGVTTTLGATDIKSSVTTSNKEFRFDMGVDVPAEPGDIFAVALIQETGIFQSAASLLCTTLTDIVNGASLAQVPTKAYGRQNRTSLTPKMPTTLAASSIDFTTSTRIPFFVLSPA